MPDGGRDHVVTRCDTSSAESIADASETIEKSLGSCSVLVNAAAVLRPGALETLSLAEWNAVLSVNLTGYFLCAQIFGRQMRALGSGSLIHVASIAGSHAQGQSGAYSVSKAGVIMLSRQLASEWGPHGIRSNVVSPGMVITPMSQSFYDTPGVTERRSAVVPLRRVGMPQDIADVILYLASDRSVLCQRRRDHRRWRLCQHADEPGAAAGVRVTGWPPSPYSIEGASDAREDLPDILAHRIELLEILENLRKPRVDLELVPGQRLHARAEFFIAPDFDLAKSS